MKQKKSVFWNLNVQRCTVILEEEQDWCILVVDTSI